jgi:hypothetical protein
MEASKNSHRLTDLDIVDLSELTGLSVPGTCVCIADYGVCDSMTITTAIA